MEVSETYNAELLEKWNPLLKHEDLPEITDSHKRLVTAQLLENTEKALSQSNQFGGSMSLLSEVAPTNQTGAGVDNYDPILISLIRRAAPNLIAYDVCGVQPMTGPTGLIFALRSHYANQTGDEAFYSEANTAWATVSGGNTEILGDSHTGTDPSGNSQTYNFAGGMATLQAEALGSASNVDFAEMAFTIDKVSVEAKSRALKAEYSMELAQDLKAIHGLEAESELANILSTETLAEINREVIRTLYLTASPGAAAGTVTTAGTFDLDTDSNGRWSVEKFKGLLFHIEREANAIAKATRRGKGNLVICSSDVASALQMAGVLDYTPALAGNNGLVPDDTGTTFVGVLSGRYKVYIDPYATSDYCVVGYKGSSAWDAGFFYCPYVPLQMVRAVGENTFQPKIGFKTRYGMVANPFSRGATASDGSLVQNVNVYYRRFAVTNIM
jgi:hypothetical protein